GPRAHVAGDLRAPGLLGRGRPVEAVREPVTLPVVEDDEGREGTPLGHRLGVFAHRVEAQGGSGLPALVNFEGCERQKHKQLLCRFTNWLLPWFVSGRRGVTLPDRRLPGGSNASCRSRARD